MLWTVSVVLRSLISLVLAGYGLAQVQSPFCPNPNGDFPNPASETCASFFRCVQGQPVALRCPDDQKFDFLLRRCLPGDDVNCERQLQLFTAPVSPSGDWFSGGQNGLTPSFPFLNGQTSDQQPAVNQFSFLNGLPQGTLDQLFPQGAFAQQTPQGQNAFFLQIPPGQGAVNPQFLQGNFGQQFPQGQQAAGTFAGVFGQGAGAWQGITAGSDGQLTANGKKIGRVFPTSHGTVIVITKQPGQQQAVIPNIQKVNTVPVNRQQPATPTGNRVANQPVQPVQSGPLQPGPPNQATQTNQQSQGQNFQSANQPSQTDYNSQSVQANQIDVNSQMIGQQSGAQAPGFPLFVNGFPQDPSGDDKSSNANFVNTVF